MTSSRIVLRFSALALLQLAWPLASSAQEPDGATETGHYLSLGSSAISTFTVKTHSPTLSPARIRTRPGYDISAGMGYRSGRLRVEGKIMYGRFNADDIRFAEGGGPLSGYFELQGAAIDLFHDFLTGTALRPYLGMGLGAVRFRARDITLAGFPPTVGDSRLFMGQLMAGMSYAKDAWNIALGYRYQRLGSQDYETGGASFRGDPINAHAVQLGAQFGF